LKSGPIVKKIVAEKVVTPWPDRRLRPCAIWIVAMEEVDKGRLMIRMGVSGTVVAFYQWRRFLLNGRGVGGGVPSGVQGQSPLVRGSEGHSPLKLKRN